MKFRNHSKPFLAIACFLLCVLCLGGAVFASENSPHRGYMLSEDAVEYRSQIEMSLRKEEDDIHKYVRQSVNLAYGYQIETDTIFVEYEMDYRSLREFGTDENSSFLPAKYADNPIFLAPLTGKIGGEMRIFGYIGFHRTSDGVYSTERSVTEVGEAFRNGERRHDLEQLTDDALLSRLLLEKGAGEAQEILLVRLSVGDSVDRVAAVKTDSGVFVLDLTDHVWDDNEPVLYEMEEFVSMLDAKNKGGINEFLLIIGGAFFVSVIKVLGWLLLAAAGITLAILIIRKIIRKRRAAREK